MYLNQFDFLHNAVGIENAAKVYFNKKPIDLTKSEAAMLVGMCKNPSLYNPYTYQIKNYRPAASKKFNVTRKNVTDSQIQTLRSEDSTRAHERRNQVLFQWKRNTINGNKSLKNKMKQAEYDSLIKKSCKTDYQVVDHRQGIAPYFRESLRGDLSVLFKTKNYYESAKIYKSLIKQDKENEDYYLELSKVYLYDNNLRLSIKTYNDLEKLKGVNHYTSTQKHKLYLELKDFNKAATELENLLIEFPYDTEIYEILSDCYILSGDFDKALEILIKLSELKPNSPSIHLSLSDFYLQKGNYEKYREELLLAFSSEKLDVQLKIKKIVPLLTPIYENKLEKFDFVFELSKIIVEIHPFDAMSNYIYADLLRIDQKTELSVSYYKKVVEINKNEIGAWEEMLFLELRLNRLDSLNTDSEQAIEIFPTNPIFYYLNGLSFYYKKNYEKTIEPIKTGVNFVVSNPNLSSEMYSILGNSYNELKDFENSDISYERALEYIPDNVQVLNNYAYYLSLREENLERAEKMSKKTIEMFPEEANYLDTYAWILYKMKKYEQAKIWMQKAIDISESETFYSHMAEILIELGEKEEAEFYLEKSKLLKENPKNE